MKLDPKDGDSWYFEGACYQELKQFDKAIVIFEKTLESIRFMPRLSSAWRDRYRGQVTCGGEGRLRSLSAFDEYEDFFGAGALIRRARPLLDGDGVKEPETVDGP